MTLGRKYFNIVQEEVRMLHKSLFIFPQAQKGVDLLCMWLGHESSMSLLKILICTFIIFQSLSDAVIHIFPYFRHTFWQYRKENPQTKVGEPYPAGLPGFNSGVMLLDLSAMRASRLYNKLLEPSNVAKLADQYRFRGHLGDQDFFTMIGMEHPELFYSLACGWNRQLCTWWRDHGYADVFQLYYHCGGPIYIYHGNCNSPIPQD